MENRILDSFIMDISIELFKLISGKDTDFKGTADASLLVVGNYNKLGIDFRYDKEYVTADYKSIISCLNKFLTISIAIEAHTYMNTEKLVIQFIADNTFKPVEDQYIDIAESVNNAIKNIKSILKEDQHGSISGSSTTSRRKRK